MTVSVAEAKKSLSEYINKAHYGHEEIIINKHGKPVVVMIDVEEYKKLKLHQQEDSEFKALQIDSMAKTWDNKEDEAWNEL
ncbi:MAG: type II toxin-antitoxin system Phd/YefM family antitoxin [Campylobacterales bacterium]|nr:type II toxin-antitoxin system Phd/YefM family antitoxin [Campylobacterales bacterium]